MAPHVIKCAVCKKLRRSCPPGCIFLPYFPANDMQRMEQVHSVYGNANVGKKLHQTPLHLRAQTANALYTEAQYRIQDPVLGSAGVIDDLRRQLREKEVAITILQAELNQCKLKLSQYEAGSSSTLPPSRNIQFEAGSSSTMIPAQNTNIIQSQGLNQVSQPPMRPERCTEFSQLVTRISQVPTENVNIRQTQGYFTSLLMSQPLQVQQQPTQTLAAEGPYTNQLHRLSQALSDQRQNVEQLQGVYQAPIIPAEGTSSNPYHLSSLAPQVPPMPAPGPNIEQLQLPHPSSTMPTQSSSMEQFQWSDLAHWFD